MWRASLVSEISCTWLNFASNEIPSFPLCLLFSRLLTWHWHCVPECGREHKAPLSAYVCIYSFMAKHFSFSFASLMENFSLSLYFPHSFFPLFVLIITQLITVSLILSFSLFFCFFFLFFCARKFYFIFFFWQHFIHLYIFISAAYENKFVICCCCYFCVCGINCRHSFMGIKREKQRDYMENNEDDNWWSISVSVGGCVIYSYFRLFILLMLRAMKKKSLRNY